MKSVIVDNVEYKSRSAAVKVLLAVGGRKQKEIAEVCGVTSALVTQLKKGMEQKAKFAASVGGPEEIPQVAEETQEAA